MNKEIIKIRNLNKTYSFKVNPVPIFKKLNFTACEGDIISVTGPSGSGKSTFLSILGLLDSEFDGSYFFLGQDTKKLNITKKNKIRNYSIGFVHQFFYLIPELNVLENVCLPNLIKDNNFKDSIENAKEILINFGLDNRIYSKPMNLSGGEQQRVAIARALINKPNIVIADEMTGNLDKKTADSIFKFFLERIRVKQGIKIYYTCLLYLILLGIVLLAYIRMI